MGGQVLTLQPNALSHHALLLPSHPDTGGTPRGCTDVATHSSLRHDRSLARQAWQREMERAQMLAWSVKAGEDTRIFDAARVVRADPDAPGILPTRSQLTGSSPPFFSASLESMLNGSVDSRYPSEPMAPAAPGAQQQTPMSSGTRSSAEIHSHASTSPHPRPMGTTLPTSNGLHPLQELSAPRDDAEPEPHVSACQHAEVEAYGRAVRASQVFESIEAALANGDARGSCRMALPISSARAPDIQARINPPSLPAPLHWQSRPPASLPTHGRIAEVPLPVELAPMRGSDLSVGHTSRERSQPLKAHAPAFASWQQSPTRSSTRISVHAECSAAGLNIWLGVPTPDVQREQSLRWIVQTLGRQLANQGLRLNRLVCNGRLLLVEDAPAQANLPFIDFSGHVRYLAAGRGAGDLHT